MKHRKLTIVGDSVQQQVFNGLEHEWLRRNFDVIVSPSEEWPDNIAQRMTEKWVVFCPNNWNTVSKKKLCNSDGTGMDGRNRYGLVVVC